MLLYFGFINVYIALSGMAVESACPGRTEEELIAPNVFDANENPEGWWVVSCDDGLDISSGIKRYGQNNPLTDALPDSINCEFGSADGTSFALKRINFWTSGASSVMVLIITADDPTPQVIQVPVDSDAARNGVKQKHLITVSNGSLPRGGKEDVTAFRLILSRGPQNPPMKVRRITAKACLD